MKEQTNKKKLYRILAAGLLIMNMGTISNLLIETNININLIDFMKGVGIVFVLFSSYKILDGKRKIVH